MHPHLLQHSHTDVFGREILGTKGIQLFSRQRLASRETVLLKRPLFDAGFAHHKT